jgi:hypothetical protein
LRHQFRLPIIASFLENHLLQIPERLRAGGRVGMLEAIYRRGCERLKDAITARSADPSRAIVAIATAYRRFALGNPALYALMFERRPPGFDLPPQLRSWALNLTFTRSSSGSCWMPCEPS